jgi:hypothetical protein
MKKVLLFTLIILSVNALAQAFESFNFTGLANANGWTTHSGTPGEISALTTASQLGNSLSYPGLQAASGNRIALASTGSEDINKPFTTTGTTGYLSFLINVTDLTGLTAIGDYFIGFAASSGSSNVNIFFPRVHICAGTSPNSFRIGILNTSGGIPTISYSFTQYPLNTTLFVVAKASSNAVGSIITGSLWINPIPGASEPPPMLTTSAGSNTWPSTGIQSIFLRQAAGTGNYEIDEIRAGETWASVTPSAPVSCVTYNTITASACNTYSLNNQTYTTTGTYVQTLSNANAAGCDSVINLNLTINNASTSTLNITNCGPYILNNQSYSASGSYTQLTQNVAGCDSTITLNLNILSSNTYYQDLDNDGYGNALISQTGCSPIQGYVSNSLDCDDNNNAINPNATEICDGLDNNCNGQEDEGLTFLNYYFDGDSDGYGIGNPTVSCSPIAGYATQTGDCDDSNNSVYPGATDTEGNGIDENCDGIDGVVSVTELQFESTIAPNPSSGLFEVQLNSAIHLDVLVLDLNGKVQAAFTTNSKTIHLDLTQLNPGTYFLNLVAYSQQSTHRLVKL